MQGNEFSQKASVVEARQAHVDCLKGHIRQADIDEVEAAYGAEAATMLQASFDMSDFAYAIERGGRCICVYGVTPAAGNLFETSGNPWLIADDEIDEVRIAFAKHCPRYLREMQDMYPTLRNWVDARNEKTIKWLRWLGFDFMDVAPYGVYGLPFYEFFKER